MHFECPHYIATRNKLWLFLLNKDTTGVVFWSSCATHVMRNREINIEHISYLISLYTKNILQLNKALVQNPSNPAFLLPKKPNKPHNLVLVMRLWFPPIKPNIDGSSSTSRMGRCRLEVYRADKISVHSLTLCNEKQREKGGR